ncbi:MAG TPA: histidinol-phosphatase [Treponemataceae bacterium]|nr:histidinol-phosphatase [Treponemataceae bacterium]
MSISSFHTHTRLCKHASGDPVDYVRVAAAEGCRALGFSDHCPYPDGTWQGSRMAPGDVGLYARLVEEARAVADFPVYGGFECEWWPAYRSWYADYLRGELGAEYLVYGSHWVDTADGFQYIAEVSDRRLLARYVDLTVEGVSSGLYDFFAHPDLFLAGFTALDAEVRAACVAIVDAAVSAGLPLEVNGLGLQRPWIAGDSGPRAPYPVREFWEIAAERGAKIIYNSDAHRSEDVLRSATRALEFARSFGLAVEDPADVLGFLSEAPSTSPGGCPSPRARSS